MERKIHRETSDALLAEINEHRLTEEALRASGHRLQDILDYSTAVVSVKDLDLRYIFANREYERQFHVRRDQIHGKTDYEIHPRAVADTVRLNDLRVIETGTPIQFEAGVPMAEGERLYIFVKFLLRDPVETPCAVCGIATDITASKRAEEIRVERARDAALRADIHSSFSAGTQSTLATMLQRSAQAIVNHFDAAFARIWTLNDSQNTLELQASAGLYTRLDGEHARVAVGKLKIGLIAQERRPHLTNDVLNDKRISHPEWAKREGIVAFAGYPLLVEGRLVGVLAMFSRKLLGHNTLETLEGVADTIAQNIERKRAEEKLARLNRTLQTLYQCNQALVRATEEYELLHSVCRILVDVGGLRMAWVGYRELDDEKTVRPVASAGYEDGYLEQIDITWADTERGRGPMGTAIRTRTISANSGIRDNQNMAPWQSEALRRGYGSSIALPLICRGEAFGALALYAEEPDAFNEKTVEQYADLANNLAYGVTALRTRDERKRAEEALRESEQRLQDIIDNSAAVVFVKDLQLRYLLVNREYERRHRLRRDQIRGKTDFDIHPHDVAEAVCANDRQVIESGIPIQFEEAVPSVEGQRFFIAVKFLLRDRAGKPYAVCGIATDITERKWADSEIRQLNASLEKRVAERTVELVQSNSQLKQAEEELRRREARLRESEERFSTAFRASPLNITILRLSNARFVEANDAFVRWFGLERDKIIGHDSRELNIWVNLDERAKFLADLRRKGSLRDVECRLRSSRGTLHTLLQSADIIEINREPHMLVVGLDITQRKQAEVELLHTLAREKELGQLRSNFISMVSHEFRTPLGIIQSSAEILEDYLIQLEPLEREEHLQSIRKNTRRMAGLMEEVLLLGSLDAGKMEFKAEPLELRTFARRLVGEILAATSRRCPIELSLAEIPAEVYADERLLRHIFTNLLTNAIKYSDADRLVHFEIGSSGPEIVCTIRDQGIGIPEADREWLFDAFHRGHNVNDRPGTGLGLVIVKRCVDLHGGKIEVESQPGEGTLVTVRLPLLKQLSPNGTKGPVPRSSR